MLEGAASWVFFDADSLHIAELDDLADRFGPIGLTDQRAVRPPLLTAKW